MSGKRCIGGSLAAQRQQSLIVERWRNFQGLIFRSTDILYGIMKKDVMPPEVGGKEENDYLRAKCAYLK